MGKIQNSDDSLYQQDGKEVNINSNKQFTAQKEKKISGYVQLCQPVTLTLKIYFQQIHNS